MMMRYLCAALLLLAATEARGQDFSGTWRVTGTDPARGAFEGSAQVTATPGGYRVQRLVAFATRLPDGRELHQAWNATARNDPAGLRVDATLRRANVARRAGSVTRTLADRTPLAVTGLMGGQAAPGPVALGAVLAGSLGGTTETWTRENFVPPPFPATDAKLVDTHAPPSSLVKLALFTLFHGYHQLPAIAPYVPRPEFQRAVHALWVDRSAFGYYRLRGPNCVVVLDTIVDDVSIAEEGRRARAFSRRLVEKASLFDADVHSEHADQNGMVAWVETGAPSKRTAPQSIGLYSGLWGASQYYRWRATADPVALDDMIRAAKGSALCIDVTTDKTEFARGVDFLQNAPPGFPGVGGKYSWAQGTGAYSNLIWMRGGNNDMLHGFEFAFMAAEAALPPGHPTRAEVGKQAASLLDNVKIAQSGNHEMFLSWVAWRTTGDARFQRRYQRSLAWRNILQKLYLRFFGNGLIHWQGISDWSGHNLETVTFLKIWLLGGASPDPLERSWWDAANAGIRVGHRNVGLTRNGIVSSAAAFAGVPGARDLAASILCEIPYPKTTGDVDLDPSVSAGFCLSPYPSLPWKRDWMTNHGRVEALFGHPIFYRGGDDNLWARTPFDTTSGATTNKPPGQDYLLAYWFLRASGLIGPND